MIDRRELGLGVSILYTTFGLAVALYNGFQGNFALTWAGAFMGWSGYLITHHIETGTLTDIDEEFGFSREDVTVFNVIGLVLGGGLLAGGLHGLMTTITSGDIVTLWLYGFAGVTGYSILHYVTADTFV
ncbi:MAG: hypothetical protein SV186_02055 [Candidatus Nanohaloarchaea archaeon]|nr:hypothetical protein [Candidatus Nanohaloarchaea archaeon]